MNEPVKSRERGCMRYSAARPVGPGSAMRARAAFRGGLGETGKKGSWP